MDNKKIFFTILGSLLFLLAIFTATYLTLQQQELRKEALTPTQKAKLVMTIDKDRVNIGETQNISAKLTDLQGNPLPNQKIVFGYDLGWNYSENVLTDASGEARYALPIVDHEVRTGFCPGSRYQANAYFQGNAEYLPVYGFINFTTSGSGNSVTQTFTSNELNTKIPIPPIPFYPHDDPGSNPADKFNFYAPYGALAYRSWKGGGASNIGAADNITLTLPDGSQIKKPVILGFYFHHSGGDLSGYPETNDVREAGCAVPSFPKYQSQGWRDAYAQQIRQLGQALDGKLTGIMVSFGYDGEASFVPRDGSCDYRAELAQLGLTEAIFNSALQEAISVHLEAFPNTPIFVQSNPHNPADGMKRGYGYKTNLWTHASGTWPYKNLTDAAGSSAAWMKHLNLYRGFESKIGEPGSDAYSDTYWMVVTMLAHKPDFIDFFENRYPVFRDNPWFYEFVFDSLNSTWSHDSQRVWTVLREVQDSGRKRFQYTPTAAQIALDTLNKQPINNNCNQSGFFGDFMHYLYRKENMPSNKTVPLKYNDPIFNHTKGQPFTNHRADRDALGVYGYNYPPQTSAYTARRTDEASGNHLMSFDIDNGWIYSFNSGNIKFKVYLTYLDYGNDTLSLEYKNRQGELKKITINKNNTRKWIRKEIELTDAYFADQLEGMTDIRINSNNDGDEIIHSLDLKGFYLDGPPPPTIPPGTSPSPTTEASPTPITPSPTASMPTGSPVPTSTPTSTPVSTTTPSPTSTPKPGTAVTPATPTVTGSATPTSALTPAPTASPAQPTATPDPSNITSVNITTALQGVPYTEGQNYFHPHSAGREIIIAVNLISTNSSIIRKEGVFVYDMATRTYRSKQPLVYQGLTAGPYIIQLKGPMHLGVSYCFYNEKSSRVCQFEDLVAAKLKYVNQSQAEQDQFIWLEKGKTHSLNLSAKPILAGDLPIAGAGGNLQDNQISIYDYSFMLACLKNRRERSCVERADVNYTGLVDNIDLGLITRTMREMGQ